MQCLALPPPAPTHSQSQPESLLQPADEVVGFRENRLIIKVHAAPLGDVLASVTKETGVAFFLKGPAETPVTADFEVTDLEKGIKRLIRGFNSVFYYGASQPGATDIRLTSVLVISKPDSRKISVIQPTEDRNPEQGSGAAPYQKLFEDIDRLKQATSTDDSAIDELARLAEFEENELRRVAAVEALGETGDPQLASLLFDIALEDDDFGVRAAAVDALVNVSSGQEAVDYLLQTLNDQHPQVRAATLEALASVDSENATDALMKAIKDEGSLVRVVAVTALADIGDERAAPALIEALGDTDEEVREYAKEALAEMGIQKTSPEK